MVLPGRLTLLAAALLLCRPARARAAQGGRRSALMRREVLAVDSRGQMSDGAAQVDDPQDGTIAGSEEKQAEPDRQVAYRDRFVETEREAEERADLQARAGALGGSMPRAGGEEGAGTKRWGPLENEPEGEDQVQSEEPVECRQLLDQLEQMETEKGEVRRGFTHQVKLCMSTLEDKYAEAERRKQDAIVREAIARNEELNSQRQASHAKQAKRLADKRSNQAIKDTRQARKDIKVAQGLKDKALVEKSCTMDLSKQVGMDIYVSDWHVNVPEGAMIQSLKTSTSAHRCPNSIACSHTLVQLNVDRSKTANNCVLSYSGDSGESQCQKGYDSTTPGCASCTKGFGRSNADPFICEQCGNQILQWLAWLGVPIMLYAASVRSAFDAACRGSSASFSNDALKILLAFSSASALVASTIDATPAFRRIPDGVRGALSISIHASGGDATVFASSLDCLVSGGEQQIGLLSVVGLALAQPAIAMLLAMTAQYIQRFRARYTPDSLLVCYIVATNQFVPLITAACARSLVCYHTQLHPLDPAAPTESWLSHESLVNCSGRARYSMITVPLAAGAIVAGPLLWIYLIHYSAHDHAMKFITGSYTEGRQYWEAFRLTKTTVLAVTATLAPTTYSPTSKLAMALFTMTVFLGAHMRLRPYKYQELNDAEGLSLLCTCCSMICASVLATDTWSSTKEMQAVLLFLSASFLLAAFVYLVRFYVRAKYHELFSEEEEEEEEEEDHAKDAEEKMSDDAEGGEAPADDPEGGNTPAVGLAEEGDGRHPNDDESRGDKPPEPPPQAEVPRSCLKRRS
ncbi:unnamed protein product [Prorocentrum cordatum]|uniref:Uncharacterized protein n=1 Tax=Prorocentrum cordatum TaxID=2364126 RepID=A0ABN9S542_9DINO|nr:unnamed protein product [Polarella glacialis]